MRRLRPARENLIVDSEKADHASRNAADRFQRAKSYVALKELSSLLHGGELLGQVMAHHAKIDSRFGLDGIRGRAQLIDDCSEKADIAKFFFAIRLEKLFDGLQERLHPFGQRTRVLEVLRQSKQRFRRGDEASENSSAIAFYFIMGKDAFEEILLITCHGITKQQSAKSVTPGIGVQRGQAATSSVSRVDPPTDGGLFDPIANQREIFITELKPGSESARAKQGENLGRGVAAAGQIQKSKEGVDRQALASRMTIRQGVGDAH